MCRGNPSRKLKDSELGIDKTVPNLRRASKAGEAGLAAGGRLEAAGIALVTVAHARLRLDPPRLALGARRIALLFLQQASGCGGQLKCIRGIGLQVPSSCNW